MQLNEPPQIVYWVLTDEQLVKTHPLTIQTASVLEYVEAMLDIDRPAPPESALELENVQSNMVGCVFMFMMQAHPPAPDE